MDEEEIKEWDNALLDILNKGLIQIAETEDGQKGFILIKFIINSFKE